MTQKKMTDVMTLIFTRCHEFRYAGQKEYAHDSEDAFRNFNSAAERLGLDRKEILWIFLDKHLSGILAHIKGHTSQREDVTGRIGDAIVYLCLLEGMVIEERESDIDEPQLLVYDPANKDHRSVPIVLNEAGQFHIKDEQGAKP